jgi:integrase
MCFGYLIDLKRISLQAAFKLSFQHWRSSERTMSKAGYVFTTNGTNPVSGFARAKKRIDQALPKTSPHMLPWVIHDLRRTLASGSARLGIKLEVIEKVLNHVSGSFRGIVGVYQHHTFADEKRVALEAWGEFVEALVK